MTASNRSAEATGADSLSKVKQKLAKELPVNGIDADIRLVEDKSKIRVRLNGGLAPFARGIIGRISANNGLTVEWTDSTATISR